jgi:hypothetical protein
MYCVNCGSDCAETTILCTNNINRKALALINWKHEYIRMVERRKIKTPLT